MFFSGTALVLSRRRQGTSDARKCKKVTRTNKRIWKGWSTLQAGGGGAPISSVAKYDTKMGGPSCHSQPQGSFGAGQCWLCHAGCVMRCAPRQVGCCVAALTQYFTQGQGRHQGTSHTRFPCHVSAESDPAERRSVSSDASPSASVLTATAQILTTKKYV